MRSLKVDSLKGCMRKIVLNRIRLIEVKNWPSYPLGHLRVEYPFLVINWLPSTPTFDELDQKLLPYFSSVF